MFNFSSITHTYFLSLSPHTNTHKHTHTPHSLFFQSLHEHSLHTLSLTTDKKLSLGNAMSKVCPFSFSLSITINTHTSRCLLLKIHYLIPHKCKLHKLASTCHFIKHFVNHFTRPNHKVHLTSFLPNLI